MSSPYRANKLISLERLCDQFESSWQGGKRPLLTEFVGKVPPDLRSNAFGELLAIELAYRVDRGEQPTVTDYQDTFRDLLPIIQRELQAASRRGELADEVRRDPVEDFESIETLPSIPGVSVKGILGRGGMGTVYLGEQNDLRRMVAVKMLRTGSAADRELRARFRTEVEAAASLQHPNIVQIHQVGQSDGQPYCLLEYVAGGNLREFLRSRPQEVLFSAHLVRTLALAIAHAHQRGIIHRDLKPANILLEILGSPDAEISGTRADVSTCGRWGDTRGEEWPSPRELTPPVGQANPLNIESVRHTESTTVPSERHGWLRPKIADFGLARRLDRRDVSQTHSGTILGTPNYLAPEQAAGGSKHVGPATDIYALGAVLYELLTGRPPHQGSDLLETLQLIRTSSIASPRTIRPSVPRDLNTICLKCLASDPGHRYSNATELADDLGRFLRHEPVRARAVSVWERAYRWCRRERTTATLLVTLAAIMISGLVVSSTLWNRNRRLATARLNADRREIERQLSFIDREEFAVVPQMDEARRQFLQQLAAKCQTLLNQNRGEPAFRQPFAQVQYRLGTIDELLGRYADAEKNYRRTIDALEQTSRDGARSVEDDRLLGRVRFKLASCLTNLGRLAEAENLLKQALQVQSANSPDATLRADGAESRHKLGNLQLLTGRFKSGDANLRRALAQQRDLIKSDSVDSAVQLALAQTETGLAQHLTLLSAFAEAESLLDSAVARQEKLVRENDAQPVQVLGLARSLAARSRMRELAGHVPEGEADGVRAHMLFKQLADEHPHRFDYRIEAGFALQNVSRYDQKVAGDVDFEFGRDPHPLERRYRDAMRQLETLMTEFPEVVENRRRLAVTMNSLATWLQDKSMYESDRALSAEYLSESEELHRRSELIWTGLVTEYPTVVLYKNDLARCHQRYGIVLDRLKRWDEAERRYRQSIVDQEDLARQYPQVAQHRIFLCALRNNLGVVCDRRGDATMAESLFREAITEGRRAETINPLNPVVKILLADQHANLADIELRKGRHQEAAALVDEVRRLWPRAWWSNEPVFERYQACIAAANEDSRLSSQEKAEFVEKYQLATMTHLTQLIADVQNGDSQIAAYLNNTKALSHVRERQDFQRLVSETIARFGKP